MNAEKPSPTKEMFFKPHVSGDLSGEVTVSSVFWLVGVRGDCAGKCLGPSALTGVQAPSL